MAETLSDYILLYLEIAVDEVGAINAVCHNATYKGGGKHHIFRSLLVEEAFHCRCIHQVKLVVSASHVVGVAFLGEIFPNSRVLPVTDISVIEMIPSSDTVTL